MISNTLEREETYSPERKSLFSYNIKKSQNFLVKDCKITEFYLNCLEGILRMDLSRISWLQSSHVSSL